MRLMKNDCHVFPTTPLPSSVRRWARRTFVHIKYVFGTTPNRCDHFFQQYVGSDYPSSHSYPSSVLCEPSRASLSSPSSQDSVPEYFPKLPTLSRPRPKIQIASLLANPLTRYVLYGVRRLSDKILSRSYHLEIVQHPQRTAEFGYSSLSRLPITPPIIARLTVRDPCGNAFVPYVIG